MDAIPRDEAWRICEEVRRENQRRWYSYLAWWCWGCARSTKGDPTEMCVSASPDYRGCPQVNARYDREAGQSRQFEG